MNKFYNSKANKEWTWDSETKNEIYIILIIKLNKVKNVAVLNKFKSSDHSIVRCKVTLNLKRVREKLFRMKPNISGSQMSFAIRKQNKYSQLVDEVNGNMECLNDNLTNLA